MSGEKIKKLKDLLDILNDAHALFENLKSTQERCNDLLQQNRDLKLQLFHSQREAEMWKRSYNKKCDELQDMHEERHEG